MQQLASINKVSIRQLGINLDHWYVVAQSVEVQRQPLSVVLWHQAIVLYRDHQRQIHALEDRCPHRQVRLSHGQVAGDRLQCAYHGWCFDPSGECVTVPYLDDRQKLPTCSVRSYPVKEHDGFIWIFPGNPDNAETVESLRLPEWNHIDFIASVAVIRCEAHFSYIVENLVDLYHGHLHQLHQVWEEPVLVDLQEEHDRVNIHYEGQIYYQIDRVWSFAQLFIPALRRLHPASFHMSYLYPHWKQRLGEEFRLYCLFCPVSETTTRAYLVHFTSLEHLHRVQKLPGFMRRFINDRLFGIAQKYLNALIQQDVQMMEEEQQSYLHHPERRNYELNPAIASVQRLMQEQVAAMPSKSVDK